MKSADSSTLSTSGSPKEATVMAPPKTSPVEAALPARRRQARVLIVLPVLLSALLVAPAAVLRKATEVHVSIDARQLSFALGGEASSDLLAGIRAHSLTLLGFRELTLGHGWLQADTRKAGQSTDRAGTVRIHGVD